MLVRVTLQMGDHDRTWGTVAVSTDLNRAISQCLIEGLEYAIISGNRSPSMQSHAEMNTLTPSLQASPG
jgi:hypothetical protein